MTKLPASWLPDQPGTVTSSTTDTNIDTESSLDLITESGLNLIINPNTITPKEATLWS